MLTKILRFLRVSILYFFFFFISLLSLALLPDEYIGAALLLIIIVPGILVWLCEHYLFNRTARATNQKKTQRKEPSHRHIISLNRETGSEGQDSIQAHLNSEFEQQKNDLEYIATHLDDFCLLNGVPHNPYAFYWLRSHPEQPADEYLYDKEVPMTPLEGPYFELENGQQWLNVFLSKPLFTGDENQALAYRLLQESVQTFIFENAQRETPHPSDLELVKFCRRMADVLNRITLDSLIEKANIDFEGLVQSTIINCYQDERHFLEALLEEKRVYIHPKISKARMKKVDEYGEPIPTDLSSVMQDILSGIKLEAKYPSRFKLFRHPEFSMINLALAYVERWFQDNPSVVERKMPLDGLGFEDWVAERLNELGFESYVTQGSVDQGIDVVAKVAGGLLAIQCKRYEGSVGNKAVQEAFAGAKHMGINHAAVLTNAEYTPSAYELARSTGVLLLNVADIPNLAERLRTHSS